MELEAIFVGSRSFTGKKNNQDFYVLDFASNELGTFNFFVEKEMFLEFVTNHLFGDKVQLFLKLNCFNNKLSVSLDRLM